MYITYEYRYDKLYQLVKIIKRLILEVPIII